MHQVCQYKCLVLATFTEPITRTNPVFFFFFFFFCQNNEMENDSNLLIWTGPFLQNSVDFLLDVGL